MTQATTSFMTSTAWATSFKPFQTADAAVELAHGAPLLPLAAPAGEIVGPALIQYESPVEYLQTQITHVIHEARVSSHEIALFRGHVPARMRALLVDHQTTSDFVEKVWTIANRPHSAPYWLKRIRTPEHQTLEQIEAMVNKENIVSTLAEDPDFYYLKSELYSVLKTLQKQAVADPDAAKVISRIAELFNALGFPTSYTDPKQSFGWAQVKDFVNYRLLPNSALAAVSAGMLFPFVIQKPFGIMAGQVLAIGASKILPESIVREPHFDSTFGTVEFWSELFNQAWMKGGASPLMLLAYTLGSVGIALYVAGSRDFVKNDPLVYKSMALAQKVFSSLKFSAGYQALQNIKAYISVARTPYRDRLPGECQGDYLEAKYRDTLKDHGFVAAQQTLAEDYNRTIPFFAAARDILLTGGKNTFENPKVSHVLGKFADLVSRTPILGSIQYSLGENIPHNTGLQKKLSWDILRLNLPALVLFAGVIEPAVLILEHELGWRADSLTTNEVILTTFWVSLAAILQWTPGSFTNVMITNSYAARFDRAIASAKATIARQNFSLLLYFFTFMFKDNESLTTLGQQGGLFVVSSLAMLGVAAMMGQHRPHAAEKPAS